MYKFLNVYSGPGTDTAFEIHGPWDTPGKNTGVGCHAFLQGIFPTDPGIKPKSLCLLHWQAGSLPLAPPGKPLFKYSWLTISVNFCCIAK